MKFDMASTAKKMSRIGMFPSPTSVTQPVDTVDRVAVGSFNKESPFYQMNLNDLKPFAYLQVKRLDVYPLVGVDCDEGTNEMPSEESEPPSASDTNINDEPQTSELKVKPENNCAVGEWGEWTTCITASGTCGDGTRTRFRKGEKNNMYSDDSRIKVEESCQRSHEVMMQSQHCFVECL